VSAIKLLLRERAASVVQTIPTRRRSRPLQKPDAARRGKAYEMYSKNTKGGCGVSAVLIAQRTLMQLEVSYLTALESFATSSLSLQSYLLTDGLESPAQPAWHRQPVRRSTSRSR